MLAHCTGMNFNLGRVQNLDSNNKSEMFKKKKRTEQSVQGHCSSVDLNYGFYSCGALQEVKHHMPPCGGRRGIMSLQWTL